MNIAIQIIQTEIDELQNQLDSETRQDFAGDINKSYLQIQIIFLKTIMRKIQIAELEIKNET